MCAIEEYVCDILCFANILWHAVNVAIGERKMYVVLVWSWRISKRYTCTSLYNCMENSKLQAHASQQGHPLLTPRRQNVHFNIYI